MASSESPLSSSSSSDEWSYDVFLSFRGEDTRKTITDHLYSALIQAGIRTFRDDNDLPRGEEISPQLLRAIEGSRISVVVFSRNYASSRWCLDELVKIMECRQNSHQVVLPTFYDTDPSDVRKQTGSYAKAFDEHEEQFKEEMEKVNRWREALTQAANLSGRVLHNETNGYEAELIKTIVNNVACKLGNKTLHVAKHPIGISSRVRDVISLLKGARNSVGIMGIYGIPGIGKTTIAKAVFNNLYFGFEGSSFLSGVKEISDKPNGLVKLQERLLHDILKPNVWNIINVYEGMNLIKERLHRKNVLVVFDDVDKREQLEALMGERCWFGDGSKIIVVTKNKHLLTELEVDGMYHAMELDRDQSLQLFSLHAFRETRPAKDYEELSEKVVDYCEGLPLALEILGSHLSIRDKAGWEIDIAHWRNIPHDDIQGKLRVSFDALDVDSSKIFLDIACFFVGKDKDYVADIVGACYGCHPEVAFRALIGRSLIRIDIENQNRLWMHDIVRNMGREIIRQSSHNHPGNCRRIVLPKDASTVLSKEMETTSPLDINIELPVSNRVGNEIEFIRDMHVACEMHDAIETIPRPEKVQNLKRGSSLQRPSTNQADESQGVSSPPKKISCLGLGSYYDQICSPSVKHDVIMDDVQSVFKEKIEPIASMLEQSNAILDKLAGDEGRIQVGVQGLEQGAEEELICLHPEAVSGMEYIQHVDRNDSLEQTRLMESNSERLVQPDTSASSTKLVGRASVKNAIWSCLMDDKVSIIGIYGMGGNGKTTMLKNICNELLERHSISHSIYWVNVPQDFRIDRSQDLIAERLYLNLSSKDDDRCSVVDLAKELMMKQKWILILNDLWNSFDPQELGIPIPLNGSKFIMTTRSKMVCQQMNCQNSIRVDPLSDEEAWTLFMEKLGHDRQLSQEEKGIAEDAVRECAGLPLGIVTLAESLKGVHELYKWKITLKRLKESNFWEMEDQIFQILRLSYDCLDDSAKQCFVYCALFDESHKIERGELIESFIEEGIIKEFDKGHSILDSLENVCLLERIDDGSAVKMHDLLRDMAIQILADEYSLDMAKEERG